MTREQFEYDVDCFGELIYFCNNNGYESFVEDIYDECTYDDLIDEEVADLVRNGERWWDIRDRLENMESGYEYYYRNDWGDWEGISEGDFDSWYTDLLNMLEEDDFFELEEDDEELIDDFENELESIKNGLTPIENEDFSIDELFTGCSAALLSVSQAHEAGCVAEI